MEVLTGNKTFVTLQPLNLATCTKKQIKAYFINSYELNESLFLGLKDEKAFYLCPDRLRLPLVFYYAHTAAVYVNKLMLSGLLKERINLEYETMFETGVDEMSWDDTENYRMGGSYEWPPLKEVVEYRKVVKDKILKIIDDTPLELPITMDSPWWALMMGMDHERIHLETSSVLIRQLPINFVKRPSGWMYGPLKADAPVKCNKMVKVKSVQVTLGKPTDFPSYGWDNEYGEVTCSVPAFEASEFMVTNKQFLEFVEDGGYQKQDLWTDEGWKWVQFREARHPTFWCCDQGCKSGCGASIANVSHCNIQFGSNQTKKSRKSLYKLRLMFDLVDLAMDWPAEVNYHEAKAFCKWKGEGYRMPVEAEHHVMRGEQLPASRGPASDIFFWKDPQANLKLQYGSSTPVNLYLPSETGFYDVFGNAWEWVEDHFNGLTGFHTHFLYDDFSSPCFDGKHNIILGGSWVSTNDAASRFGRYAFRRHFFQHCGFRLARSLNCQDENVNLPVRAVDTEVFVLGQGVEANKIYLDNNISIQKVKSTNSWYIYDTLETLEGILELEFGFRDSFPAVLARCCGEFSRLHAVPANSAVHFGTATGRGSFELSKTFDRVLGVEMCGRLIDAAIRLQAGGHVTYGQGKEVRLDDDYNLDRIVFKQLTWVPNEVESHEMVLITHLDRVQNVKAWLVRLWEITKPNGIAVIACKDGKWNKESLHHHLHHRLMCVGNEEVEYEDWEGKGKASVTIWKYKKSI